jgi:hypothetical protein
MAWLLHTAAGSSGSYTSLCLCTCSLFEISLTTPPLSLARATYAERSRRRLNAFRAQAQELQAI